MNLLIEVTSDHAAGVLVPLAKACNRTGVSWACFFTGDGVLNLSDETVAGVLDGAVVAVACEFSWQQKMGKSTCPIHLGSQTNNSTFVGDADKVISL